MLDWELPSPSKEAGGARDPCRAEPLCYNPWPRSQELPEARWVPPPSSVMNKLIFPSAGGQVLTVTAVQGCSLWNRVVPRAVGSEAEVVQG